MKEEKSLQELKPLQPNSHSPKKTEKLHQPNTSIVYLSNTTKVTISLDEKYCIYYCYTNVFQ